MTLWIIIGIAVGCLALDWWLDQRSLERRREQEEDQERYMTESNTQAPTETAAEQRTRADGEYAAIEKDFLDNVADRDKTEQMLTEWSERHQALGAHAGFCCGVPFHYYDESIAGD